MKKFLIFIAILALLAGAGVFFLQKKAGISVFPTKKFEVVSILPEKPVVYLELGNTEGNVERLMETPFWKALGEVNWPLLASTEQDRMQAQVMLQLFQEGLEEPKVGELLSQFLGNDIAIAVYPFEINVDALSQGDPRIFQQILSRATESVYFVTRLETQAQVAEVISRSQDKFGDNVTVEDFMYKDQLIKLLSVTGLEMQIAYTRINDLLILALDKFAVQRSIDVHQEAAVALKDDPKFVMAQSDYIEGSDVKMYLNTEFVMKTVVDGMSQVLKQQGADDVTIKEQLDLMFKSVQGFKSIGISALWEDTVHSKWDFHINRSEMQESLANYYNSCVNVPNNSINFIPDSAVIYQWGYCFDMKYYWDEMMAEMERTLPAGSPSPAEQVAQYERMIGLTVENDILQAFGKEIGGYINTVHLDGKFPIPELLLFLKINNQAKADRIFNLLRNQPIAMFQAEEYKGVTLNYISLPIGDNISPGYAFVNDYVLIAINKDMLMSSIDVSAGAAAGVTKTEAFQAVNKGLSEDNIGLMYVEVDELAFKVSSIIEWSNDWASNNDRQKDAFKKGAEMRLTQVQKRIEEDEEVLNETQEELTKLNERVVKMRESGQDLGMMQKTLTELEEKEAAVRGEIEANIDEAIEIQETIKGYSKRAMPADERAKYLEGIVYPLVDTFKTIEGFSSITTMSEEAIESNLYMKL